MLKGQSKGVICGSGINDSDTPVYKIVNGVRVTCPLYRCWVHMIQRCFGKNRNIAYDDCTVHKDWIKFSGFRNWAAKQDYVGKQLDKDLLVKGNKVYGPDTCLFVSGLVNKFMTDRWRYRGELPIGVAKTTSGKFQARCCDLGSGMKVIGLFKTAEDAHNAYTIQKASLAIKLASLQTDKRVADALINRYVK